MKQILIIVLVVVGIIGGAVIFSKDDAVVSEQSNNFYGAEQGVVTLTEYGDFECPACAGFFPIVSQVKEQFKDQLRFEFKHFPLVQIHQNATAAHRAAQAAANQGKFWEMHDLLYERQNTWNANSGTTNPASIFEQYAREIGLDIEKYTAEVNSSEILATINADVESGKEKGTNSTPSFYLDGVQLEDLTPLSTVEGFTKLIQDAIDKKNGVESDETQNPETEQTPQDEPAKPEETTTE